MKSKTSKKDIKENIANAFQKLSVKYSTLQPETKTLISEVVEMLYKQLKIDKKYLTIAAQFYLWSQNNKRAKAIKDSGIVVSQVKPKQLPVKT